MSYILIYSFSSAWLGKFPKSLKSAGFDVIAIGPSNCFWAKTKYVDKFLSFDSQLNFRKTLFDAIRKYNIKMVIPGGDNEIKYLYQLIRKDYLRLFRVSHDALQTLTNSNNPDSYYKLGNKSELQTLARQLNIPNPNNRIITSFQEIKEMSSTLQYPIVLKRDYGSYGAGVKICSNTEELMEAYQVLSLKKVSMSPLTKIKIGLKKSFGLPVFQHAENISVQDYIKGETCTHNLFASHGEVLSSFTHVNKECYPPSTGPSSVIRVIKNKAIEKAAALIINNCKFSGFASFDFMLDENEIPYILECNPRPTPTMHLSDLCGANLCEMVNLHFDRSRDTDSDPYPDLVHETIALFPNELKRDPLSRYVRECYHDVPYDDPSLLKQMFIDIDNDCLPLLLQNISVCSGPQVKLES